MPRERTVLPLLISSTMYEGQKTLLVGKEGPSVCFQEIIGLASLCLYQYLKGCTSALLHLSHSVSPSTANVGRGNSQSTDFILAGMHNSIL